MTISYLKKANKNATSLEDNTRGIVESMLKEIELGGEQKCLEFAEKLDNYQGNVVVSAEEIAAATATLSQRTKDDIRFAYDRVFSFAQKQRAALIDFEIELSPGLWAGQKQIPMNTAGCYVPGGRYAHVASAVMSVATAKAAGVEHVIACSPPKPGQGVNPAIIYTANLAGADTILALGGVQGIAAMAFGLFTGKPADILVGPGNRFVAEAKRMLYGRVGIDLFAGPTEIAIIADKNADPHIVATDLVGQAEHGPDSPVWLITTDRSLGEKVIEMMPGYIAELPETARKAAESAWGEYGEVILCDSAEEAASVSDQYAAEHLEVMCDDLPWWVDRLKNYGSLFVGEETTVAFGDKCSGTNHILPTKGAARYTGGLSAGKFIKTVTTQRMTREANREVAAVTARISRLEGMEAHARTGDERLAKYFPDETFQLQVAE
ncbi:MAG: histidinol dehydrogenase [Pseudomonadales bacterium]|nr:histidinol dehydrogenase [Pseudomonadales bacterium]NRA17943.1 histidinol dehydrogenase [Oceanospirillaceae bacterium]